MREILAAARWRIPAFYFFHFFSVGVTLPFLNIYYHSVGITGAQLGFLNAAARVSSSLAPPAAGILADRLRRGREIMLICTAVSSLTALALWGSTGFWALLVLIAVYSAAKGAVGPIAENVSLRQIEKSGEEYGRLRWWGSLGFIVAALGMGWLIEGQTIGLMFPVLFGSGMVLIAVVSFFPRDWDAPRRKTGGDLRKLLRTRPLMNFYGAAILMSVSAGPFGLYFSIYLRELGMPATLIGLAWTAGVVSEIFFLWYAGSIQRRFGLKAMIAAGIFASALRWELTTWTTNAALLVAIQTLHGVTFGVYHVGAVQFVDRMSGEAIKNTGQALYGAATFGAGSSVGVLIAGWLLPRYGFAALMHAGAALALVAGIWFWLAVEVPPEEIQGESGETEWAG